MKLILGGQTGEVPTVSDVSENSDSFFAVAKKRLAMDLVQVYISPEALLPNSLLAEGIVLKLKKMPLIPFSSFPLTNHQEHGELTRAVLLYVPKATELQKVTSSGGLVNGEALFDAFDGTLWHGAQPWPDYTIRYAPTSLPKSEPILN